MKSVNQEQYTLDRRSPIMFPPDVTGKEIIVRASMGPSSEGMEGVVVAQGGKDAGYSLYVQDGKLHWIVKQKGKTYEAVSTAALPEEKFNVVAKLTNGGNMSIDVNNKTVAKGKAPALFASALTPEAVRVGHDFDDEDKIGGYPNRFFFKGDFGRDGVLELKKPAARTAAASTAKAGAKAASTSSARSATAKTKAKSVAKAATVNIKVVEHEMKFDKESFTVKAGQKVTIYFENPDFMQHNLVVAKPGTLEKVGKAADALARDPEGAEKNYVPQIPEVIVATRLVDPQGRETLVFTVPEKPGEYPFVCTVPGHWRLMNGVMKVEANNL